MDIYQKIILAFRNIECIFEDIKDSARNEFPAIIHDKFGGKNQIQQCIKEILIYCHQIEQIDNIPIDITKQLKQKMIQLRGEVNQLNKHLIEKSQLEYCLECCYGIRTSIQKLGLKDNRLSTFKTDFLGFVLYVEPEEDMRCYVQKILIDDKWYVKAVPDAETALKIIQEETPDLILSAISLPGIDGFEFVRTLRSIKNASHLPIILLTARSQEEARIKGLQLGAEDYITKPFSSRELCMRIRIHCELSRLRIQSAQKAEDREQLLDNLCHELRNPLQGIYGNIQFLHDSIKEIKHLIHKVGITDHDIDCISISLKGKLLTQLASIQESLESIHYCAKHQKLVTEDMLQLSKLDAKKVELNISTMDPKIVIKKVISMCSSEIQRKKIHLRTEVPDMINVLGDDHRLEQILVNLVTNSLKFTEDDGSILIKVNVVKTNEEEVILEFIVKDSGVGIKEEELKRLFNRFSQANRKTYQQYGGIGLGLQISKKLVELMGGTIEVESEPKKGSLFRFTIVCQPNLTLQSKDSKSLLFSETKKNKNEIYKDKKLHVLIVEDNIINQKLLLRQLKKEGYSCSVSDNGKDALQKLEEKQLKKIDVVLMDIEMPIMNGLDATRERRSREKKNNWKPIPIIGVSGNAFDKHKIVAITAGMNDYITKPYNIKTLISIIDNSLLKKSIHSTAPVMSQAKKSPKNKTRSFVSCHIPLKSFSTTIQATISPDRTFRTLSTSKKTSLSPSLSSRSLNTTTTQLLDKMIQSAAISPQTTSSTLVSKKFTISASSAEEAESLLTHLIKQLFITYPVHIKNHEPIHDTYLTLFSNYYKRLESVNCYELITENDIFKMKDILEQLRQPPSFSHTQFMPHLSTTLSSSEEELKQATFHLRKY
jgi:DNA-binding response OmpR family regulator